MAGITAVLSIMTHDYNTRAKKDSAVTSESLQNLEGNIIKDINSAFFSLILPVFCLSLPVLFKDHNGNKATQLECFFCVILATN